MVRLEELKGWDMMVFSYGRCPFCGADIYIDDYTTECNECGTRFYLEFDENNLLSKVFYEEIDSDDSFCRRGGRF